MLRKLCVLAAVFSALVVSGSASADLIAAGDLLVDLRAEDLAYGNVGGTWTNHGTLSDFSPFGSPVVEDVAGLKAVTFNGSSWFEGPTSVAGIEGAGDRTIEVWALNPSFLAEETTVSWSHRGGPEGTNMSFNYGNDTRWGAMGHWGGDTHDMGWWTNHVPAPAAGKWWHLVYTYDGVGARIYVNGVLESTRNPLSIDTYAGNIIRVGAQADNAGTGATLHFSGSIAEVRIHDGVLSATDIMNNYEQGGPKISTDPFPGDGAVIGETDPILEWTPSHFAQSHQFVISTDYDTVANATSGPATFSNTQQFTADLVPGATYYWKIIGINASDPDSPFLGEVWSFSVVALKATEPTPSDGAINQLGNVRLQWQEGYGAEFNQVFLGTDFATVEASETPASSPQVAYYDPSPPFGPDTTVYWRIDTVTAYHLDTQTWQVVIDEKVKGDVWSYSTIPTIAVGDPNLVGWWKLDEGTGSLTLDWSGQGNHGTLTGGYQWLEAAAFDGGVDLDGSSGYVNLPIGSLLPTLDEISVSAWVNFNNSGGSWQRVFDFGSGSGGAYMFLCPRTGTGGPMRLAITTASGGGESYIESASMLPGGWHQVVGVIGATDMAIYLDGDAVASGSTATIVSDMGTTSQNWLGRSQYDADGYLDAAIDDVRIYNFAMSVADIPRTLRGDLDQAYDPNPKSGATVAVDVTTALSWVAGDSAGMHDVYFGTDRSAVEAADVDHAMGVYRGSQAATSYPVSVAMGQAYYWRIDEQNSDSSLTEGRIWSFTVLDHRVVDDFESYGDLQEIGSPGQRIWYVWWDGLGYLQPVQKLGNGSGSEVNPSTDITDGSSQALSMLYDGSSWIEALTSDLPVSSNWTAYGTAALNLRFRGYRASVGSLTADGGGAYTMTGSGADIWGNADQFHFAYVPMTGVSVTSVQVKVNSLLDTDAWAKCGVMVRGSLEAGSAHAMMIITPQNGASFQRRPIADGASESTTVGGAGAEDPPGHLTAPMWLRIERNISGQATGLYSTDGVNWEEVDGPNDVDTGTSFYVGVALTSHNAARTTTATWQDLLINDSPAVGIVNSDVGIVSNTPGNLYVELSDGSHTGRVNHPDNPNAITSDVWDDWDIALSEFAGVNPGSVQSITIGVDPVGGATTGEIFVDNIRLYTPRYVEGKLPRWPQDIVDDRNGRVDGRDAAVMFGDWLEEDYYTTAVVPGSAYLVGHYPLDSGFADASAYGHHGDPLWSEPAIISDGQRGNVATFDGVDDFVDLGTWNPSEVTGQLSVTLWAKWAGLSGYYQGLIGKRDSWAGGDMMWQLEANVDTGIVSFLREGSYPYGGNPILPLGEWAHVAVTFDGTTATLYVNGRATGSGPFSFGTDTEARLVFGACEAGGGNPFNGELDDVRIYSVGLSEAEIVGVMYQVSGEGYVPVLSPANMSDDEAEGERVVNFKDFAVFVERYGTTQVWP